MLDVAQAWEAILNEVSAFPVALMPLAEGLGLILADDIVSDIDSPPFDKALMDGFAVRAADLEQGTARLRRIDEVTAGRMPSSPLQGGETIQIMTGAPIPEGADAVVRVEDTQLENSTGTVFIQTGAVRAGMNIMRRGTSMRRGDCILPRGRKLRAQELGALAELGKAEIPVRRRPRVAVLATGDELVPVDQVPGPGQIRNSNETMLAAQIRQAGGEPVPLGIARDNRRDLSQHIRTGLQCDLLLLSGGVSAGKLDLVPSELEAAGVRQVFHKVRMKPGKPVWFGVLDADRRDAPSSQDATSVFGLPGNPVSSLVCFELFVRPTIRRLMGVEPAIPTALSAQLEQEHRAKGDRPTYFPARLTWNASGPTVQLVRWHGSADLRATVEANAMAFIPAGDADYPAGSTVDVYPWD